MENDNVCKFVPSAVKSPEEISAVNFVFENTRVAETERVCSVYALHLVTRGSGVLVRDGKENAIKRGDVFFVVPGCVYAIKQSKDFEYAYISFLGLGAPSLIKRVSPDYPLPIFAGNDDLIPLWRKAVECANSKNIDMISKSVLEYSAARLIGCSAEEQTDETFAKIARYVREHFTDADLSLKELAAKFGYNEKYLSKLFKAKTGVYFKSYVTDLRINAACGLMQSGKTSVKQIAAVCGFSDALYFSKAFKAKIGLTPTQFLSSQYENKKRT